MARIGAAPRRANRRVLRSTGCVCRRGLHERSGLHSEERGGCATGALAPRYGYGWLPLRLAATAEVARGECLSHGWDARAGVCRGDGPARSPGHAFASRFSFFAARFSFSVFCGGFFLSFRVSNDFAIVDLPVKTVTSEWPHGAPMLEDTRRLGTRATPGLAGRVRVR